MKTNPSVLHYNVRYLCSLCMLMVATAMLLMQFVYQYQVAGVLPFNFIQLLLAGIVAMAVSVWSYQYGLILRKACAIDSWCYLGFLIPVLFILLLLIMVKGFDFSGLSETLGASLSAAMTEYDQISPSDGTSGSTWNPMDLMGKVWEFLWNIVFGFFSFFLGVIWRMMQFLLLISLLIASVIVLTLAHYLRIRSGKALFFAIFLALVCLWAYQASESYTGYMGMALLLLLLSIALVTNWRAIQMNRPVWEFHPVFYDIVCNLATPTAKEVSRNAVRETITLHLQETEHADKAHLIDKIEDRLVEDLYLERVSQGRYRPKFRKRLGVPHLLAAGFASIYLLNGGFGMFEIIPDVIPVIGNLDEAGIASLVTWWLYNLYLKDKEEEEGQTGRHGATTATVPHMNRVETKSPAAFTGCDAADDRLLTNKED